MRVIQRSGGLEPASLRTGEALVLEPEPWHGDELPPGTVIDDFLDVNARRDVEREALASLRTWRQALDTHLTVDSLCLPFIWELEIYSLIRALTLKAAGMRAAFEATGAASVEPDRAAGSELALIRAVAEASGLAVGPAGRAPATNPRPGAGAASPAVRARRAVTAAARRWGVPSRLGHGSVVFLSYWPLEPVLDRMLAGDGPQPAVMLDVPPAGPARTLRAAAAGGWIGAPGPFDRRTARTLAGKAIDSMPGPPPISSFGVQLGPIIHDSIVGLARSRAADDLARARMLRRLLGRSRPAAVLTAWDTIPIARLVITLAKEAGIPSYAVQHGLYLPPTILHEPEAIGDFQFADTVLVWSERNRYPARGDNRSTHIVGYPLPHPTPPPTRRISDVSTPTVIVLAQVATKNPPMDARTEMRHWLTAISRTLDSVPAARIVLRPHPSAGLEAARRARESHPEASIAIDASTPIETLLAGGDLCIGAITAATLQSALVGTPVIALNLSGFVWEWPLGAKTTVPIARSAGQLGAWIERWRTGEQLPGREDLLGALGANGADAPGRIIEILARQPLKGTPANMSATIAPDPGPGGAGDQRR